MARTAEHEHARERQYDAAALRIAERVRSSLDLYAVLQATVDELGQATRVSRSFVQLAPDENGVSRLLEWNRGDVSPLSLVPPTPDARKVFDSGEPLVIENVDEAEERIASYLRSVGAAASITLPVGWQGRVVAVIGFQESEPRTWHEHALPLLQRVDTQVAAAIAQAELFEQQQQALRRLEELGRMRDEVISTVSHELRTPLTSISGFVQTLRRRDLNLGSAEVEEILAIIESQTERLKLLADDLLDLSRFRHGTPSLRFARVQVTDVLATFRNSLTLPPDRELTLVVEDDCALDVDVNRIVQVLVNLVENAIRHGAGTIGLRQFVDGPNCVFRVSDEGGGVDEEFAEEMFLPFSHRGDRPDSTGLGLAIARAVVEAHDGTLVYLAAREGDAHQFVVTLPRRQG